MTQTPPGWYPDGSGQRRWWDGNQWTEHVEPAQAAEQVPPAPAQPVQQPAQPVQPQVPQPPQTQVPAQPVQAGVGGGYGYQAPAGQWPPTEYLEGAGSDFEGAVRNALQNLTEVRGRASRSSFWWFYLSLFVIGTIAYVLMVIAGSISNALGTLVAIVIFFVWIALVLATVALGIRRLHDTDRSGWWLLLGLVPCVGILLIVFLVLEGTPGPNQYNIKTTA